MNLETQSKIDRIVAKANADLKELLSTTSSELNSCEPSESTQSLPEVAGDFIDASASSPSPIDSDLNCPSSHKLSISRKLLMLAIFDNKALREGIYNHRVVCVGVDGSNVSCVFDVVANIMFAQQDPTTRDLPVLLDSRGRNIFETKIKLFSQSDFFSSAHPETAKQEPASYWCGALKTALESGAAPIIVCSNKLNFSPEFKAAIDVYKDSIVFTTKTLNTVFTDAFSNSDLLASPAYKKLLDFSRMLVIDDDYLNMIDILYQKNLPIDEYFKKLLSVSTIIISNDAEYEFYLEHNKDGSFGEVVLEKELGNTLKSVSVTKNIHAPKKELHQFYGIDKIKEWAADIKDYLSEIHQDESTKKYPGWNSLQSKVIFSGAPGCGKTSVAEAIAYDCNIKFIPTSYAEFQSSGTGHLGDLTVAMKKKFEEARKNAPCILFIDELDSFSSRIEASQHKDWNIKVINALLEEVDGAKDNDGVIMIGATNFLSRIDPALRRSGRLGKAFEIALPNHTALAEIYKDMLLRPEILINANEQSALQNEKIVNARKEFDYSKFGKMSVTMSGADVEEIVARINARDKKAYKNRNNDANARYTTEEGVLAEIAKFGNLIDGELKTRCAYFIAGQAIVAKMSGLKIGDLSVLMTKNNVGVVAKPINGVITRDIIRRIIISLLSGGAAEELVFKNKSANKIADFAVKFATHLTFEKEGSYGLNDYDLSHRQAAAIPFILENKGAPEDMPSGMHRIHHDNDSMKRKMLDLHLEARVILSKNIERLHYIARELGKSYTITVDDFEKLWDDFNRMDAMKQFSATDTPKMIMH